ncbi:MAG: vWA domain-containing protein [bacterium]
MLKKYLLNNFIRQIIVFSFFVCGIIQAQTSGIIIFDASLSMKKNDPANFRQEAGKMFFDSYSKWRIEGNMYDYKSQFGIINMGKNASIIRTLTTLSIDNIEAVRRDIIASNTANCTDYYSAFKEAIRMFDNDSPSSNYKFIILLSDGIIDPNNINKFDDNSYDQYLNDILPELINKRIAVYSFGLLDLSKEEGANINKGINFLKKLADATDGEFLQVKNIYELFYCYNTILSKLHPIVNIPQKVLEKPIKLNKFLKLLLVSRQPISFTLNSRNSFTCDFNNTDTVGNYIISGRVYGNNDYYTCYIVPLNDNEKPGTIKIDSNIDDGYAIKDFRSKKILPERKIYYKNEVIPFSMTLRPVIQSLNFGDISASKEDFAAEVSIKRTSSPTYSTSFKLPNSVDSNNSCLLFSTDFTPPDPGQYEYRIKIYSLFKGLKSGIEKIEGSFVVKDEQLFNIETLFKGKHLSNNEQIEKDDTVFVEVYPNKDMFYNNVSVKLRLVKDMDSYIDLCLDKRTGKYLGTLVLEDAGKKHLYISIECETEELSIIKIGFTKDINISEDTLWEKIQNFSKYLLTILGVLGIPIFPWVNNKRPRLNGQIIVNRIPNEDFEEICEKSWRKYYPLHSVTIGFTEQSDIIIDDTKKDVTKKDVAKIYISFWGNCWLKVINKEIPVKMNGNLVQEKVFLFSSEDEIREPVTIEIRNNKIEI